MHSNPAHVWVSSMLIGLPSNSRLIFKTWEPQTSKLVMRKYWNCVAFRHLSLMTTSKQPMNSPPHPGQQGRHVADDIFRCILLKGNILSWLKYIVCDVCGLRSPSFESSSVLYVSPTNTSSMQNLILEGLQQKWQKSCSRCNKNTRHVESSYILQPPKYMLLFVNRFKYINNNVTHDRCPIPVDTTVRLGPLKFSLQATIDHHGPSMHSSHYTASINCCIKPILLQRSHNYGVWNYW